MCDNKLQLIFDELYRKTTPCVRINNESLVKALKLAKAHCFALDGCCSSRVKTSITEFERILTQPRNSDEAAVSAYFQCPASARGCCDDLNDGGTPAPCDDSKCDDHNDDENCEEDKKEDKKEDKEDKKDQ